jgi:hypothetical protein
MSIYINIFGKETLPPTQDRAFFRVLHDVEMGPVWRKRLPEVHPLFDSHFTPFTEAWQRLSYRMNTLTKDKWTALYGYQRAFTNNNGFRNPDDPRRNYITGEDLREGLPKVEALVCGGALLTGSVSGSNLVVETLNGRGIPPVLEKLMDSPWLYFHAVTVDGDGTPRRFPQADGRPVLIPLIADRNRYPVVTIPLSKLQRWNSAELPDPYRIYT